MIYSICNAPQKFILDNQKGKKYKPRPLAPKFRVYNSNYIVICTRKYEFLTLEAFKQEKHNRSPAEVGLFA
jgi:hypothetical protein